MLTIEPKPCVHPTQPDRCRFPTSDQRRGTFKGLVHALPPAFLAQSVRTVRSRRLHLRGSGMSTNGGEPSATPHRELQVAVFRLWWRDERQVLSHAAEPGNPPNR